LSKLRPQAAKAPAQDLRALLSFDAVVSILEIALGDGVVVAAFASRTANHGV